ncbi:hypothetical protein [Paenibacillus alvei]|uniref:Uncharacterized protein n=1 Tax=Paenibacillus alvei TaxID=44250 RepID=A0A383RCE7_PAEAL|nr:hypothetical protein [Paenibacillus alvei]SYX83969.1 protein of unknown function [Paenibacillus alvei]
MVKRSAVVFIEVNATYQTLVTLNYRLLSLSDKGSVSTDLARLAERPLRSLHDEARDMFA